MLEYSNKKITWVSWKGLLIQKILLFRVDILFKTPNWPTSKIQPLHHLYIHKHIAWSSLLTVTLPIQINVSMDFEHFKIRNCNINQVLYPYLSWFTSTYGLQRKSYFLLWLNFWGILLKFLSSFSIQFFSVLQKGGKVGGERKRACVCSKVLTLFPCTPVLLW